MISMADALWQEGFEQGLKEAREEAREKAGKVVNLIMAHNLLVLDYDPHVAALGCELSLDEVHQLQSQLGQDPCTLEHEHNLTCRVNLSPVRPPRDLKMFS